MIKELLKQLPLLCFTAIIIAEIACGFDKDMVGSAVFALFILLFMGMI